MLRGLVFARRTLTISQRVLLGLVDRGRASGVAWRRRSHRPPRWGALVLVSVRRRALFSLHLPQAALERLASDCKSILATLGGNSGQEIGQGSGESDFECAVGQMALGRSRTWVCPPGRCALPSGRGSRRLRNGNKVYTKPPTSKRFLLRLIRSLKKSPTSGANHHHHHHQW